MLTPIVESACMDFSEVPIKGKKEVNNRRRLDFKQLLKLLDWLLDILCKHSLGYPGLLTARAGLSMALGAYLAGLLHAETEFSLQVESDIAPYRDLLLGLFFMTVLHKIGAERACAATITLDTPSANYRTVWALSKYFPNVKTFVRAHDVDHGLNPEKAGATTVYFS
ncbi:hypothetical protein L1987_02488 [Smallanthus sonchifolius]|uniref:Uncharacterized protein n=1 Tax=Smallanthus sonchifolius TaxID=185202 RepID=A0ACB9K801_9ASTR|nr:hypothetical protein L1987_02488 [Smallanthus sonchifolius]